MVVRVRIPLWTRRPKGCPPLNNCRDTLSVKMEYLLLHMDWLIEARLKPCKKQTPHSGLWCNGNTTGFGSVILSSNLGNPTKFQLYE